MASDLTLAEARALDEVYDNWLHHSRRPRPEEIAALAVAALAAVPRLGTGEREEEPALFSRMLRRRLEDSNIIQLIDAEFFDFEQHEDLALGIGEPLFRILTRPLAPAPASPEPEGGA